LGTPSKKRTHDQITNIEGGSPQKDGDAASKEKPSSNHKLKADEASPEASKAEPAAEAKDAPKEDQAEAIASKPKVDAEKPDPEAAAAVEQIAPSSKEKATAEVQPDASKPDDSAAAKEVDNAKAQENATEEKKD